MTERQSPTPELLANLRAENARLSEELARKLESERRRAAEEATLQSLTLLAERADAFDELAATTIRQVVALLGAAAGSYALIDGDELIHSAWVGVEDWFIDRVRGVPAGTMTPVRRLRRGDAAYVQPQVEGAVKPENLESARRMGFTAYAAVPVRIGDRLEALMMFWFNGPVDTLAMEHDLEAVSRIAGISLANFRLRERLVASETRYRVLFEELPEAILLVSPAGDLIDANAAALSQYGAELESLRAFLIGGDQASMGTADFGRPRLVELDGLMTISDAGIRPDGTSFPEETRVVPVEIGGERRYLVIVRDLTEQHQLQQELLQAQKMEAIGHLVSGVAHELNNPLAAIVAFSQLLSTDERLPDDMRRDADLLVQEADRTRRIVANLLDFARQRPPERHPTSLRNLVDSVMALQSYGLSAGQITLTRDVPADLPLIEVDRSQIQQVLLNLTLNAIQAIRSRGTPGHIWIAAHSVASPGDARMVRLSVSDDGPGIPIEARSRIFLPFFTSKAPGEGTGLGLSVSFGIVAAHEGTLRFEPRAGGGATFIVELPASARAAVDRRKTRGVGGGRDRAPATEGTGNRQPTDDNPGSAPAVLILDDEPAIRAFLVKSLQAAGFRAVAVATGEEAIEKCEAEEFAAVLVDHRMPGMSGTNVFDALVGIRPDVAARFIFMSGDVLNPELHAYATRHGIALLAKPFDLATVKRLVAEVSGRGGSGG